jgi:hypothetical protein
MQVGVADGANAPALVSVSSTGGGARVTGGDRAGAESADEQPDVAMVPASSAIPAPQ